MAGLLIVYGTTEGQTRTIAEAVAAQAGRQGYDVELYDATALPSGLDPDGFSAIVIAGSVHQGRHQTSVAHFVRHHLPVLQNKSTAFISVSLSAAGDAEDRHDAQTCADRFLEETRWRPTQVHLAAGAFRFTQYDFFKRWVMKWIARSKGAPTDTSHDVEYTDWTDLARFIREFLTRVEQTPTAPG